MDLQDKVAVITGALGDVELATARRFADEGARVLLCPLQVPDQREALPAGIDIRATAADAAAIRSTIDQVIASRGRIDLLVNGEGRAGGQALARTERRDWDGHLAANLTHVFEWCRAAGPLMQAQGAGTIVNVAWNAGRYRSFYARSAATLRAGVAYASSQGGILALTRELALELAADGVRVNAVVLGLIATREAAVAWDDMPQSERDDILEQSSLGRLGTPAEAAAAICFLASARSSYVTGSALDVNGGWWVS